MRFPENSRNMSVWTSDGNQGDRRKMVSLANHSEKRPKLLQNQTPSVMNKVNPNLISYNQSMSKALDAVIAKPNTVIVDD
jgi:hypothetical protein